MSYIFNNVFPHEKSVKNEIACNFFKKEVLTQVFSSEFCEIFKHLRWLLLHIPTSLNRKKPHTVFFHRLLIFCVSVSFKIQFEILQYLGESDGAPQKLT